MRLSLAVAVLIAAFAVCVRTDTITNSAYVRHDANHPDLFRSHEAYTDALADYVQQGLEQATREAANRAKRGESSNLPMQFPGLSTTTRSIGVATSTVKDATGAILSTSSSNNAKILVAAGNYSFVYLGASGSELCNGTGCYNILPNIDLTTGLPFPSMPWICGVNTSTNYNAKVAEHKTASRLADTIFDILRAVWAGIGFDAGSCGASKIGNYWVTDLLGRILGWVATQGYRPQTVIQGLGQVCVGSVDPIHADVGITVTIQMNTPLVLPGAPQGNPYDATGDFAIAAQQLASCKNPASIKPTNKALCYVN